MVKKMCSPAFTLWQNADTKEQATPTSIKAESLYVTDHFPKPGWHSVDPSSLKKC